MINKFSTEIIKKNFNNAALDYSHYSLIQKYFSKKIVYQLKKLLLFTIKNLNSQEWLRIICY